MIPDDCGGLLDCLAGLRRQHQPSHVVAQQRELRHRRHRGRVRIVNVACRGVDNLNTNMRFSLKVHRLIRISRGAIQKMSLRESDIETDRVSEIVARLIRISKGATVFRKCH